MWELRLRTLFPLALLGLSLTFPAQADGSGAVSILGATYPASVAYDKEIVGSISISNSSMGVRDVLVHYAYLGSAAHDWYRTKADLLDTRAGYSTYAFRLPGEGAPHFRYGWKVVFCAEVFDDSGDRTLSCRGSDRWDAAVLDDKWSVDVTDPYPPKILRISVSPQPPTNDQDITVAVEAIDEGSGIGAVRLRYLVDGGPQMVLPMVKRAPNLDIYEATIPKQSPRATVWYQIEVTDGAGNLATPGSWASLTVAWSPSSPPFAQLLVLSRYALAVVSAFPWLTILVVAPVLLIIKKRAAVLEALRATTRMATQFVLGVALLTALLLVSVGSALAAAVLVISVVEFHLLLRNPRARLFTRVFPRRLVESTRGLVASSPGGVFILGAYLGAIPLAASRGVVDSNLLATYMLALASMGVLINLSSRIWAKR